MSNNKGLSHSGVLGMHWGKHKGGSGLKNSPAGKAVAKGITKNVKSLVKNPIKTAKASADHIEKNKLKLKKISEMSNDEIMKLTRRINLEKQVKDLRPNAYKKGMNIVKGVTAAGTTIASLYALTQTPLAKSIAKNAKEVIKKKVG